MQYSDWVRWSSRDGMPKEGVVFEVIRTNGTITNAYINDKEYNSVLMIQEDDGQYVRETLHFPTHWRLKYGLKEEDYDPYVQDVG